MPKNNGTKVNAAEVKQTQAPKRMDESQLEMILTDIAWRLEQIEDKQETQGQKAAQGQKTNTNGTKVNA